MTVGRRTYPVYQDRNVANTLPYFPMPGQSAAPTSKSLQYGGSQFIDEQTVPQALYQPQMDSFKDLQPDFQNMDPLAYNNQQWYSQNYPYNSNFMAYPVYQPNVTETSSAIMRQNSIPMRQNSIPRGSLDQYLDNSGFDYEQVLENLDFTQYENPEQFSLEDYADLEQVNQGMNFEVKQEKPDDEIDGKNLEEMENVLNSNMLNTTSSMVGYNNGVNTESPVVLNNINIGTNTVNIGNDQTLDEQNLIEMLEFYSSPNSAEWPTQSDCLVNGNQLVAGEAVVKTEPNDSVSSSCDLGLSNSPFSSADEGSHTIGISDEELIHMPVSRFNELIVSLSLEQSNLAKDIRRRGKNKQAARLCRKRKLDNISSLEETLSQMQEEKLKLLNEQKALINETKELKSNIDMICEMLVKGLNEQNIGLPELSLLHGQSI